MDMKWRLKSCSLEDLTLLASGALPGADQTRVREHVTQCAACRQYFEQIGRLSENLQQWAATDPTPEPSAAFRARWTESIQGAAAPSRRGRMSLVTRFGEWLWPSPLAWGALA